MRALRFAAIGLFVVVAGVFWWRAVRLRPHSPINPHSAQPSAAQPVGPVPQSSSPQAASASAPASESAKHLGPFSIAGQNYAVELQTRKVHAGSTDVNDDTVVAMEIRNSEGAVQYRKTFPYLEAKEDYFESWSVSALLLTGTSGTGLLVSYDLYSEPSAPVEEPVGWYQVFGVLDGKFVPFGAPLEVMGGLLTQYADSHTYKAARPLGAQADVVEFKVWAGHCRLIFPVRVDWAQGKLSPAQECAKSAGELGIGCQYKVLPENNLYINEITFVRLWPNPDEKSGQPVKTVVKKDSKVDLLTAQVATQWTESKTASPAPNSQGPLNDAGGFGIAPDTDLWLKVRIDGKEGWVHTAEDFRALGLPEEE